MSSFVCEKLQENWGRKERDKDTFKLKTLFWGSVLFCDVERFPEPIEVITFPRQGVDIYIRVLFSEVCFVDAAARKRHG